MNCRYCGSLVQPGALFCVECGRSVAEAPASPVTGRVPATAQPTEQQPSVVAAPSALGHCPQCGGAIEAADIFCGECGFVLRPMTGVASSAVESVPAPAEPVPSPAESVPSPAEPSAPSPDDVESTRVMASRARGERYVLQFSTGESIVVAGTGLIGRNPSPEPSEYVDELVAIFDVGKSVSKTHVEFGQESGRFWVSDRYSTNGTVVRQPDTDAVRCEPGKRYLVARGSRVEIGEQFFIVS